MPTTPDTQEGLKTYINELRAQGKTESTSKDLAKAVIKLKQYDSGNFDLEAGGGNQAILQRGVEDPTPETSGLGTNSLSSITSNVSGIGSSTLDLQSIYDQAMGTDEITGLKSDIASKKEALTTALSNINDNPFYSEATRTGKIAKLNEQAQSEINDLVDQLTLAQSDAQTKYNIALQQYEINSQAYQTNLQTLNTLLSTGGLTNVSSTELAQLASATGLSSSMIQSMIDSAAKQEVEPYVVNSTDDYGNVTVSIIDLNTGNLITSNSLGQIGSGSSTRTPDDVEKYFDRKSGYDWTNMSSNLSSVYDINNMSSQLIESLWN